MDNTKIVIEWIGRMSRKYGGTVTTNDGEKLDWGQALCRARYGKDWNKITTEEGIEEPDDEAVTIAMKWERKEKIPNFINSL